MMMAAVVAAYQMKKVNSVDFEQEVKVGLTMMMTAYGMKTMNSVDFEQEVEEALLV